MARFTAAIGGRGWARLSLVAGWALFFAPAVFTQEVPYYRDHLLTNLPLRQYAQERLRQGELPQWYPYESLGVPVIGQIALGTFHPFNLLLVPFSAPVAEKWALLGAYLFALCGAYRLARALRAGRVAAVAAAFVFGLGGYALGVSSIIAYAMSLSALPWTCWAALRVAQKQRLGDAALLGLLWSLVFLSGDAVGFLLSASFLVIAFLEKRTLRNAALLLTGGVIASLVVGIEFIPALEVSAESVRVKGIPSPLLGTTWALHPMRIFEFVIPGYVPDEVRNRVVEELFSGRGALFATTLFAGPLALLLAVAGGARRTRFSWCFVTLALVGFWLSLGSRGGLLPALQSAFPLMQNFRYPERYLAFFWLGLSVLAGFGLDDASKNPRRWALVSFGGAGLFAVAAVSVWWGPAVRSVWSLAGRSLVDPVLEGLVTARWSYGLAWGSVGLALCGACLLGARRQPAALAGVVALIFAELWRGNGAHLPLIDRRWIDDSNAFVQAIHRRTVPGEPPSRVFAEFKAPYASTVTGPQAERETWVAGMSHLLASDVSGLHHLPSLSSNLGATQLRHVMLLGNHDENAPLWAGRLNTCFRVGTPHRPLANGERRVETQEQLGLVLIEVPCLPRAYLAKTVPARDLEEARRLMADLGRGDGGTVVWEGTEAFSSNAGSVRWTRADSPEHLQLDVEASEPTALVLTDELSVGWTARIDGEEVPIHPTLLAVRGVALPPGRHQVNFDYRTPRLGLGLFSTLLGILTALALGLIGRRRALA